MRSAICDCVMSSTKRICRITARAAGSAFIAGASVAPYSTSS